MTHDEALENLMARVTELERRVGILHDERDALARQKEEIGRAMEIGLVGVAAQRKAEAETFAREMQEAADRFAKARVSAKRLLEKHPTGCCWECVLVHGHTEATYVNEAATAAYENDKGHADCKALADVMPLLPPGQRAMLKKNYGRTDL